MFDLVLSILLLPILVTIALGLLFLNPWLNAGPLFYVQRRMGKSCAPFNALKFRTMHSCNGPARGPEDPLETDRITRLGLFLRQSRIDELPQILNVLRGEMSLIGPRPDCYEHAMSYLTEVPGYRERHRVLPGISGYAQTEVGYVQGAEETQLKVEADLYYIRHRGFALELWLLGRTLQTVFRQNGQ